MYKRNAQGWSKHFDFIVLDELSLQIAFILAVFIRINRWAYAFPLYRSMGLVLLLIDAAVLIANNTMHNVVSRGYYLEAIATIKHSFICFAIAALYMFATQSGDAYSRLALLYTFLIYLVISYGTRLLWKLIVRNGKVRIQRKRSMLVVSAAEAAEEILKRFDSTPANDYRIIGVVLTDEPDRNEIGGYPVVSDMKGAADYICREWVDSVYVEGSLQDERLIKLMDDCTQMGVPTHYHVPNMSRSGVKRFSEKIGGTTVLTTSINYATPVQVLIKRAFDLFAGLFGSIFALLILTVVGPMIKKASPGPILFAQERIGKNGKRFKIYKIRSMYMDAEERKKELMEQNRVKDGMMFKLDFDPRIIGNEILPDGTKKTGIGEFIRRTSLARGIIRRKEKVSSRRPCRFPFSFS